MHVEIRFSTIIHYIVHHLCSRPTMITSHLLHRRYAQRHEVLLCFFILSMVKGVRPTSGLDEYISMAGCPEGFQGDALLLSPRPTLRPRWYFYCCFAFSNTMASFFSPSINLQVPPPSPSLSSSS
mmetsp:Transcript_21141/g.60625  ORF Transcript_21141/g.60625 Transcript_21141/m.60625 type:complete len:125 (+) Transcript_21141:83-457(+)